MLMKVGDRALGVRGLLHGQRQAAGFTIIETMVVLAITGALFLVVAVTLSGRQNAAEFTHAIQSVQSQIQQVINQVSAGYYPNNGNFSCADQGGSVHIDSVSGNAQGTNQDCVFLGKVIQFGVAGTDPEAYRVYTIAGLRCGDNAPIACPAAGSLNPFATSIPTVVGVSGDYTTYSTVGSLEYGLTTKWVHSNGVASKAIGAVGFLMEPGSAAGTAGYSSSTQQVDVVPILPSAVSQTYTQAVSSIENSTNGAGGLRDPMLKNTAPINPQNGVQICFVSATTNQSGLITIGGTGRQLLVKLDIKSNQTCQ